MVRTYVHVGTVLSAQLLKFWSKVMSEYVAYEEPATGTCIPVQTLYIRAHRNEGHTVYTYCHVRTLTLPCLRRTRSYVPHCSLASSSFGIANQTTIAASKLTRRRANSDWWIWMFAQ